MQEPCHCAPLKTLQREQGGPVPLYRTVTGERERETEIDYPGAPSHFQSFSDPFVLAATSSLVYTHVHMVTNHTQSTCLHWRFRSRLLTCFKPSTYSRRSTGPCPAQCVDQLGLSHTQKHKVQEYSAPRQVPCHHHHHHPTHTHMQAHTHAPLPCVCIVLSLRITPRVGPLGGGR